MELLTDPQIHESKCPTKLNDSTKFTVNSISFVSQDKVQVLCQHLKPGSYRVHCIQRLKLLFQPPFKT